MDHCCSTMTVTTTVTEIAILDARSCNSATEDAISRAGRLCSCTARQTMEEVECATESITDEIPQQQPPFLRRSRANNSIRNKHFEPTPRRRQRRRRQLKTTPLIILLLQFLTLTLTANAREEQSCSCSPRQFYFKLDLSAICPPLPPPFPPNDVFGGGVKDYTCTISPEPLPSTQGGTSEDEVGDDIGEDVGDDVGDERRLDGKHDALSRLTSGRRQLRTATITTTTTTPASELAPRSASDYFPELIDIQELQWSSANFTTYQLDDTNTNGNTNGGSGSDSNSQDTVPVSIYSIQFLEVDTSFNVINQDSAYVRDIDFDSGTVFNYTSVSSSSSGTTTSGTTVVPGGMNMVLRGVNSKGQPVRNVFTITYTNDCEVTTFGRGESIGWVTFENFRPASAETCNAPIVTATPTARPSPDSSTPPPLTPFPTVGPPEPGFPTSLPPATDRPITGPPLTPFPTESSPSVAPSRTPRKKPTRTPTMRPTAPPTPEPSREPASAPTKRPTKIPTSAPSSRPTRKPTFRPTEFVTAIPTDDPTSGPTARPTTGTPTAGRPKTRDPSKRPTAERPTRGPGDGDASSFPTPGTSDIGIPTRSPNGSIVTSRPTTSRPTRRPSRKPHDGGWGSNGNDGDNHGGWYWSKSGSSKSSKNSKSSKMTKVTSSKSSKSSSSSDSSNHSSKSNKSGKSKSTKSSSYSSSNSKDDGHYPNGAWYAPSSRTTDMEDDEYSSYYDVPQPHVNDNKNNNNNSTPTTMTMTTDETGSNGRRDTGPIRNLSSNGNRREHHRTTRNALRGHSRR